MTVPPSPPPLVRLAAVESTQAHLFALAAVGAVDRTVVVADHQSAGRGRRGRAWRDAPGASLLASVLVRPATPVRGWPVFSLLTAVAVAEALRRTAGVEARLKWPNDVLVHGRKIAGILLEARVAGEESALVIGVGINLAQREFGPDLAGRATSVALAAGAAPPRDALLATLLERFDAWRARFETEGAAPVRARWLELADTIGRPVDVDGVRGIAVDLDADGALLVEADDGVRRVVAGELAASAVAGGRGGDAARR